MRVVRVRVSGFWLGMVLHGHDYSRLTTDFPDDAEVIHAEWDANLQQIILNVTSASFDDVPDGYVIPEWQPTLTKHMDETAQLLEIVHRGMTEDATRA